MMICIKYLTLYNYVNIENIVEALVRQVNRLRKPNSTRRRLIKKSSHNPMDCEDNVFQEQDENTTAPANWKNKTNSQPNRRAIVDSDDETTNHSTSTQSRSHGRSPKRKQGANPSIELVALQKKARKMTASWSKCNRGSDDEEDDEYEQDEEEQDEYERDDDEQDEYERDDDEQDEYERNDDEQEQGENEEDQSENEEEQCDNEEEQGENEEQQGENEEEQDENDEEQGDNEEEQGENDEEQGENEENQEENYYAKDSNILVFDEVDEDQEMFDSDNEL
jgi:hypothetical protein